MFFYWCFWCVAYGDFLKCLVDIVCWYQIDGLWFYFDFHGAITFYFLIRFSFRFGLILITYLVTLLGVFWCDLVVSRI